VKSLAAIALLSLGALPGFGAHQLGAQASDTTAESDTIAQLEPGSDLRVWLVTAGPGDEVWERYGHNAIRVLDTRTGRDVSYNWGIFDFQQVDFIPRFLQGRMLYRMAAFNTDSMLAMYGAANREVALQELALTPSEKLELLTLAEINARPENREYVYQYFLDNCSTRVRDLLNTVLDGALADGLGGLDSGSSFRDNTRRLTQVDPLVFTGMDLLLGSPTDAPISLWEQSFLPLTLQREIRNIMVPDGSGGRRSLVLNETIAVEATREPAPAEAPRWLPAFLVIGMVLGAAFAAALGGRLPTWPRRLLVGVAAIWLSVSGVLGTILVLLLFTDHTFAFWNENLFLFHPGLFVLAVLLILSGRNERWRARARGTAMAVAGLALVGLFWQLLPISVHTNGMFIALALPIHAGVAWGLTRDLSAPTAS
jgi:hypothetical protein